HLWHHWIYSSSFLRSLTRAPYSLPRLNGGSAKTVSMHSSRMRERSSVQSPRKSAPSSVVNTGLRSPFTPKGARSKPPSGANDLRWNIGRPRESEHHHEDAAIIPCANHEFIIFRGCSKAAG